MKPPNSDLNPNPDPNAIPKPPIPNSIPIPMPMPIPIPIPILNPYRIVSGKTARRGTYNWDHTWTATPFNLNYDAINQKAATTSLQVGPYMKCENCYMFLEVLP